MTASSGAPPPLRSREVAFEIVRDVFGPEQRGAQSAFDARVRRADLNARDRAFAAELAYGSIKARRLLDWYLHPYIGDRMKSIPPAILEILRLGTYQIKKMGGVEPHAAVYETVNLAHRRGHRGTVGLVNAVLRRMTEDTREPTRAEAKDEDDFLALRGSLPTWIVRAWRRAFGDERLEAIVAGVNAAPQAAVRANVLRAACDEVVAHLQQQGVVTRPSAFVSDLLLIEHGNIGDDPQGRWMLQGESAAFPVDVLAPAAGERILEFCAGRGNKTVQLAGRLRNDGSVTSVEIDGPKARSLTLTLERARATCVAVVRGDAALCELPNDFDAVLVDAPCSALGVLGRHPEARWRKRPDDAERLAPLQAILLRRAAALVRPGGRIVYSVCSSDPGEGRARPRPWTPPATRTWPTTRTGNSARSSARASWEAAGKGAVEGPPPRLSESKSPVPSAAPEARGRRACHRPGPLAGDRRPGTCC